MVGPPISAIFVCKLGMVVRTCANVHYSVGVVATPRPWRKQQDAAAGDYDRGIVNLLGIVRPPRTMLWTMSGRFCTMLLSLTTTIVMQHRVSVTLVRVSTMLSIITVRSR